MITNIYGILIKHKEEWICEFIVTAKCMTCSGELYSFTQWLQHKKIIKKKQKKTMVYLANSFSTILPLEDIVPDITECCYAINEWSIMGGEHGVLCVLACLETCIDQSEFIYPICTLS